MAALLAPRALCGGLGLLERTGLRRGLALGWRPRPRALATIGLDLGEGASTSAPSRAARPGGGLGGGASAPRTAAAAASASASAAPPRCWRQRRGSAFVAGAGAGGEGGGAACEAAEPGSSGGRRASGHEISLEDLVSLCKRRGFVFQSSEIYGGYQGFFDYGPLGVELKNNLKKVWWSRIVRGRDDVVGLDSAIITNPRTHQASGHVESFCDPMVDCVESRKRFRADQLLWAHVELEDGTRLGCVSALESGGAASELERAAKKVAKERGFGKDARIKQLEIKDATQASEEEVRASIPSPATGRPGLSGPRDFNLMFTTQVGPFADSTSASYLRPETAQGIFVNFKNVAETSRLKVPFGVAQIGKAFRNEITPRQFLFRSREFEQMEVEYFIDPDSDFKVVQEEWIEEMWGFLKVVGVDESRLDREPHSGDKLAHYARACTDIVFRYPFGWAELLGVAARGDYDLVRHGNACGRALDYQVQGERRRFVPHVVEPSLGVDRLFLAVMCSAYDEDEVNGEPRSFLRFPSCVAPISVGIFPLMKSQGAQLELAQDLAKKLRRKGYNIFYDAAGSIGRRYRRMDEVGTPFCCCVDFQTVEDGTVTLRLRDEPLKELPRMSFSEVASFVDERTQPFAE